MKLINVKICLLSLLHLGKVCSSLSSFIRRCLSVRWSRKLFFNLFMFNHDGFFHLLMILRLNQSSGTSQTIQNFGLLGNDSQTLWLIQIRFPYFSYCEIFRWNIQPSITIQAEKVITSEWKLIKIKYFLS